MPRGWGQGRAEERSERCCEMAGGPCAASSGQLCLPRLPPPAEPPALQVCWPQAWLGSGWRVPFSWLRLVCGTGSTTQPWPVNLCLVPDRHWSCLCQKLPPFWRSLPSGTPFLHPEPLTVTFGMVLTSPCSEHRSQDAAAWAPALPQLSLSVPPGWHLFIQKGHRSALSSLKGSQRGK